MLSDTAIKALKPQEKPYKKSDSGGLYIYVLTSGSKSWRIGYRFEGKYKTIILGMYPVISLVEARKMLLDLKTKLKQGIDPSIEKKVIKQAIRAE